MNVSNHQGHVYITYRDAVVATHVRDKMRKYMSALKQGFTNKYHGTSCIDMIFKKGSYHLEPRVESRQSAQMRLFSRALFLQIQCILSIAKALQETVLLSRES